MSRTKQSIEDKGVTLRWGLIITVLLAVIGAAWRANDIWHGLNDRIAAIERTQAWQSKALHNLHQEQPKEAAR